jgi:hypothetical protein
MSEEQARPVLRIVHGAPTPEELAVVTAVVSAASSNGDGNDNGNGTARVGRWNDPAVRLRRPWRPGPGAWTSIFR